jgi:lipoate-protein ligase A
MALDLKLLEEMRADDAPLLHFYEFAGPAATYGHFMKPELFLKGGHGLDLAKRPTGGGMLFHLWDLTFSVLISRNCRGYSPDVMENYKFVNELVVQALGEYLEKPLINLLPEEPEPLDEACKHFCFAKPTKYDVMIDGKKVCGAAQRRKPNGYLHQGSISVCMPDFDYLQGLFLEENRVVEAMKIYTCALSSGAVDDARREVRASIEKVFR